MSAERGFIPISQVESEKLRFDLNLPPYIDQTTIGVNLHRVEKLCKFSGLTNVHVVGKIGDETSSSVPLIVGFDSQGGAIAGKAATKTNVPTYKVTDSHKEGAIDSSTRDIKIELNIDELYRLISQDKKQKYGVYSNSAWSEQIDKALRNGIKTGATQNLLPDINSGKQLSILVGNLGYAGFFAYAALGQEIDNLNVTTFCYTATKLLYAVISQLQGEFNNYRFSVFFDYHLDRALILNARMLKGKLVKPIPNQ